MEAEHIFLFICFFFLLLLWHLVKIKVFLKHEIEVLKSKFQKLILILYIPTVLFGLVYFNMFLQIIGNSIKFINYSLYIFWFLFIYLLKLLF